MSDSPYSIPYQHQTYNHLFFDRIRAVQLEVVFLRSYLVIEENSRSGGAGLAGEIQALDSCSALLFDAVYKPLRSKWL